MSPTPFPLVGGFARVGGWVIWGRDPQWGGVRHGSVAAEGRASCLSRGSADLGQFWAGERVGRLTPSGGGFVRGWVFENGWVGLGGEKVTK